MEIAIKRILGIALIVFGLAIFFWSISESYYYFSAQKEFPPVFVQPRPQLLPLLRPRAEPYKIR